jgi:hypothetical protein
MVPTMGVYHGYAAKKSENRKQTCWAHLDGSARKRQQARPVAEDIFCKECAVSVVQFNDASRRCLS